MNYSKKLKELRTSELLTQKDIANILSISRSTYKDYELQIKIIPMNHLNTLCNYFHISIDYFLGLSSTKEYQTEKKNTDIEKFAKRLIELRKNNKITQESMAKLLNTTHSMISDYENKKKTISTPFLYAICKKYNISADYLLGKIDKPKYLDK